MGPWTALRTCLRKWITVSGRAARPEYWWFFLVYSLLVSVPLVLAGAFAYGLPFGQVTFWLSSQVPQALWWAVLGALALLVLVLTIAATTVQVRRLHDLGITGKWVLVPLVLSGAATAAEETQALTLALWTDMANVLVTLILMGLSLRRGQPGGNRWGPPPGARPPEEVFG